MTRILLVEDDPSVSELVALALQGDGYEVEVARTGSQALAAWGVWEPDLVVLDVMLPGVDGVEVCRRMRADSEHVPIVMLTARTDPVDVVRGLETGADDYVTKPFDTRVLLSRLRAVLRRSHRDEQPGELLTVADLRIDTNLMQVRRDGEPVDLTPTEYRLLEQLVRHQGRVLSREELLQLVWGYDYLGDSRLVDVGIGRLRSKVEADPSAPRIVLTRRGFGYYVPAP